MLIFPQILILATSRHSHGGISSVISTIEQTEVWKQYKCRWVTTHRSGNKMTKLLYFISGFFQFLWLLPTCKIVHMHVGEAPSARRKKIFFRIAKFFRKKTIIHFHAFSMESTIDGPYGHVYQYLLANADTVIVLSDFWKKALYSKISGNSKIKILNNPCPIVNNSPDASFAKENIILFAGVVSPRKGYQDLIRSFALISAKYPEWKTYFAGSGEIETGHSLSKDLGIENKIKFLGWKSGSDKDELFKRASILCLPSYAEGFPMTILEAWAYGLPIVTTPVGSLPEVSVDGEDLLFFSPGDINKLSILLEKLIVDTSLRQKLSQASLRHANNDFNPSNIGATLGVIYNSLV